MATELVGHPEPIPLGNFAATERPDALKYQFLDYLGAPIDLSTGTVIFFISKDGGVPAAGAGTPGLDTGDPNNSKAQYAWGAGDMVIGNFRAQFWVVKGVVTYASQIIYWYVYQGIKV